MSVHNSPPHPPGRTEINKAPGQPTALSGSQSPPAQQQQQSYTLLSGVANLNGSSELVGNGRSATTSPPPQSSGGCPGYDPMHSVASDFFGNSLSSISKDGKSYQPHTAAPPQQQGESGSGSREGGCPFKGVCGTTGDSEPLVSSEAWSPSGGYDGLMDITVDTIEVLGVGGPAYYLEKLFQNYLQAPKDSGLRCPELARAFVTAFQLQARRACMILKPVLPKLAALEELDKEGSIALASLLCDMSCCLQTAKILFQRNKGIKMSILYYNALIRVATESSRVVDMNFAVEVANELTAHGFKLSTVTIRLILGGFSRHPEFSVKTCFNVMDWRLAISSSNIESCFAGHFFQALEMAPGNQVDEALEYLRGTIATRCPDLERSLIKDALPPGQDGKSQCCMCEEGATSSRIYLVDPFTLIAGPQGPTPNSTPKSTSLSVGGGKGGGDVCQLNALADYILPKGTFAFFLYSAIRDMCQKARQTGEDHPIHSKLAHVRNLLAANPMTTWILTLEEELEMRPPECPVAVSHHCRLMSTFAGVMECPSAAQDNQQCKFTLVTADPALEAAASHQFPGHVAKTLPFPMSHSK